MPVSKHADERDELIALIAVGRQRVSECFSKAMKHLEAIEGGNEPDCIDNAEKAVRGAVRYLDALRDYQRLYLTALDSTTKDVPEEPHVESVPVDPHA